MEDLDKDMNTTIPRGYRGQQVGDLFYIPLERDMQFLGKDGQKTYIPNPEHRVAFAQLVAFNPFAGTQVAVFEGICYQGDAGLADLRSIKEQEPKAIYTTTTKPLTLGWWPFLRRSEVSKSMPLQAYYRADEVLLDFEETVQKPIAGYEGINFIRSGISGTPGIVEEIARGINGLDTKWELEYEVFTPNPEAVVWKIFPETYPVPEGLTQ